MAAGRERSMNNGSSRLDQSSINLNQRSHCLIDDDQQIATHRSKCSSSAVGYRLRSAQAEARSERPLDMTTR